MSARSVGLIDRACEGSEDPGYTFVMPPSLEEIIEHELH
jgi:hypothetical protein